MDLPLVGGSFTWSNNCSWSRIDTLLFLWIVKLSILVCFKRGFLDCALTIFLFFPIVVVFKGGKRPF